MGQVAPDVATARHPDTPFSRESVGLRQLVFPRVLGRPEDRVGLIRRWEDLGEAKVDDARVALGVDENVLGLEVAEDDLVAVDVIQRVDDVPESKTGASMPLQRGWVPITSVNERGAPGPPLGD